LSSFRGEAPFGAWLKRLVANCAIDRLRSERRWVDDSGTVLDELRHDSTSDAQVEALGLLARMPPVMRSVLVLYQVEGYGHSELASMFGRSESYTKSLLSRGLARLRKMLEDEAASADMEVAS
jgi:RNA polymerase sigma-70 factor (ECF subfamily)